MKTARPEDADGLLPEVNRVGPLFLTIPPLWGIIERTLAQWRGSEEGWDVFLLYFLRYREVHAGGIGHQPAIRVDGLLT